ncbi:uncharacterized protein LOC142357213 isoform X2 [Convolutriloba macropyga]
MPTDDSNANSQHLNQPTNLNQRDEFQGSEDWLLVQEDNTFLARDESNKSLGKQDRISWENKRKSSTGKGRQNLDSSVVFGVTSRSTLTTDQTSQLEREVSSSGEMSSKEQQEEAAKQSTYDAIEDSLYKAIDKDTSTGSGKRVHTGNFRMKEKSEKVTTRDANATSSSTSLGNS